MAMVVRRLDRKNCSMWRRQAPALVGVTQSDQNHFHVEGVGEHCAHPRSLAALSYPAGRIQARFLPESLN
jgi:hypothetical protein